MMNARRMSSVSEIRAMADWRSVWRYAGVVVDGGLPDGNLTELSYYYCAREAVRELRTVDSLDRC